jgi:hypothetical protein
MLNPDDADGGCVRARGIDLADDWCRILGPHPDERKAKLPAVETAVLAEFLRARSGGSRGEDTSPREYPATRIELRKNLT